MSPAAGWRLLSDGVRERRFTAVEATPEQTSYRRGMLFEAGAILGDFCWGSFNGTKLL